MKYSKEMGLEKPTYGRRIAAGVILSGMVLTGCERTVAGTPTAISVIEEAAQTGSAIPLPEGLACPRGGVRVDKIAGEMAVAQAFIAYPYRNDGQRHRYLAAAYPETAYEATNGTEVYCGKTNVNNGMEHTGNMVVPNSCVESGTDMGEIGAIVVGIDPAPHQPWWQGDTPGMFVGCPKIG